MPLLRIIWACFIGLASQIVILCYIFNNAINHMISLKSKNKTQKLSFKLAPYLFIAIAIFTAFSSKSGTWV